MSDSTQKILLVLTILIIPALIVYVPGGGAYARLSALMLIAILIPPIIVYISLFTKQYVKLRGNGNQKLEKWLTYCAKCFGVLLALSLFWFFSLPVVSSGYRVLFMGEEPTHLMGTVTSIKSVIFAPGLYFGYTLSGNPKTTYHYIFPTRFNLGDSVHDFVVLPETTFILSIDN
jgi:hypothetical protein